MTNAVDIQNPRYISRANRCDSGQFFVSPVLNVYSVMQKQIYKLFIHSTLKLNYEQLFKNQLIIEQKCSRQPCVRTKSEKRSEKLILQKEN
jgi:hypothetical protein